MRQLELVIERLSKSGDGVAQVGGRAVFVPQTAPGDRVRAEVLDQGQVLRGELLEILESGPGRRTPICPLADRCGGCDWMHLGEDVQHAHKEQIVVSALEHVGGVQRKSYELLPFVASVLPYNTRRRAVLHPVHGRLGFFGRRSHTLVEVDLCPALTAPLESLPGELADAFGSSLKDLEEVHVLEVNGRVSVAVIPKGATRARHREVAEELIRQEVVAGVVIISGAGKGGVELLGHPVLEADGIRYRPDGFAQANAEVNAPLVKHAVAELQVGRDHDVLELYSGNGNFTFPMAQTAKSVLAVESSTIGLALAQESARKLGAKNVRFVQDDCNRLAKSLLAESRRFHRVLLDPPRNGAPGIGEWASRVLAERVVYVACDPGALARDAAELLAKGYAPSTVRLFDLFPQTHHVEVVMVFSRGG